MSLYGALFAGVSGLRAQSSKIGNISDNIANVNTVGYKGSTAQFQSLVTGSITAGSSAPGGVLGLSHQEISKQGLLQSTNSATDIAISGDGLFVVNQTADGTGKVLFTRAGSFTQDSTGNFVNAAGFFLQAWPLDPDGRLPGEPGNVINTTSSANLSSLRTVNVQSLTAGSAAATTSIAIGANLNAAQVAFAGAGDTATLDAQDSNNFGIKASDIIVPNPTGTIDRLTRGDQMTVSTGTGLSYTYTYGGFTFGRDVTDATSAGNGDNGDNVPNDQTTISSAAAALGNNPAQTAAGAGTHTVTITYAAHGLANGDVVTLSGLTGFDGLTAGQLNSTFVVANVTTNTFEITVTGAGATAGGVTGGGAGGATKKDVFATSNASNVVTVRHVAHGFTTGQVVTFSGITAAVSGIPASELNASFVVTVVDADHYTITTPTTAATSTGGGGSGTVVEDARPFSGTILDAQTVTQPFLGLTGTSGFTSSGLTFTITTSSGGTATFTYTSSSPNTTRGQFNSLTNLATAISSATGLTARVVDGRLYVAPTNADDAISFANGSTVGSSGPPVQAGIDWLTELGLADVTAGTNRFSSLQSLADQVNNSTGLSSTVNSPLSSSETVINLDDPLDTITFTDAGGNTGSVVAALGLVDSLGGAAFTVQTDGPLGPSYDATDDTKNMAGGTITPQFSRPVTVYDALGTAHTLSIDFLKIGINTWSVEVLVVPITDVSTPANGQLAAGTVTFNGDGSLRSVDSTLSDAISIAWQGGADDSNITFNWGTAGQPFGTVGATVIGKTDGLSQFAGSYSVNFVNQNGSQKGSLSGVAIDEDGFIIASFNNGETQRLYKIPLASFASPDRLDTQSGNVFAQTSESGEANLKQAGTSGVGKIASSSLEASNVELADQLTDMIVAQRAYQANTKVITVSDQLLDDLNRAVQ